MSLRWWEEGVESREEVNGAEEEGRGGGQKGHTWRTRTLPQRMKGKKLEGVRKWCMSASGGGYNLQRGIESISTSLCEANERDVREQPQRPLYVFWRPDVEFLYLVLVTLLLLWRPDERVRSLLELFDQAEFGSRRREVERGSSSVGRCERVL